MAGTAGSLARCAFNHPCNVRLRQLIPLTPSKPVLLQSRHGPLRRAKRGSAESSGSRTVNHGVPGKLELSAHPHHIESVIAHSGRVRQYAPSLETACLIERPRAMVVAAYPKRQQLRPEAVRAIDQRVDHHTAESQALCIRMNHDLSQLHDMPERALWFCPPAAHGLYLAADPAQGKTGTASRRRCVPITQPLTDAGARRCLKPADCAPDFYHSAHHAMDFEDGLVIDSIEPVHAGNLFRHTPSIRHQTCDRPGWQSHAATYGT